MARADRAARVAKGQRGAAIDVRAGGSPFSVDHPRLGCWNDFKDATKPTAAPRRPQLHTLINNTKPSYQRTLPTRISKENVLLCPAGAAHAVQIAWRSIIRICRSSHHCNFDGRSCSRGFDSKADGPDLREGCRLDR